MGRALIRATGDSVPSTDRLAMGLSTLSMGCADRPRVLLVMPRTYVFGNGRLRVLQQLHTKAVLPRNQ
jgi:hypothetical protein